VVTPNAADLDSLNKIYDGVIAAWVAKDERNAQVLAKVKAILADLHK